MKTDKQTDRQTDVLNRYGIYSIWTHNASRDKKNIKHNVLQLG